MPEQGAVHRYTVNCSLLFRELPLLERPAAARAAGFEAVEFWWPFPDAAPSAKQVADFEHAIMDAGVQLTALNFFAGELPGPDRGVLSWPTRSREFLENLPVVAGIGERLGCLLFNALYGNHLDGLAPGVQDALAIENLVLAAEAVAPFGGTVLVEPLSGVPSYPLRTADDGLRVVEQVRSAGATNIALLADFYHLAVNGEDVDALIAAHSPNFGHIQIADAPGRGMPGSGTLPLRSWIAQSYAQGYRGTVGLEYMAELDPFSWLKRPS